MSPGFLTTVDPATGTELFSYPVMDPRTAHDLLDRAVRAQAEWARADRRDRARMVATIGEALRRDQKSLAELAVAEMGKPIGEAMAEVAKCATACDYYAEHGPAALADELVDGVGGPGARGWTRYEPLGVLLAVMPWNFPFWQVIRCVAPALVAGNAVLLKHSPNVTGCALALERLFLDAGLPQGLFGALVLAESDVPSVVAELIADDRVAAVTLTGSERAGSAVASAAGAAIKKSVLELGGSDPFVVLDDADLDAVVPRAVASRYLNGGQSCLSAKRFVVHESLAGEFAARLAAATAELVVGDPADPETQIGPLARADLVDALHSQVRRSVADGARVLVGGAPMDGPGCWYAPTVLAGVTPSMAVMTEETFGPVAAVVAVPDDDTAVEVANGTRYGLAASVWSRDTDRAMRVGARITSGALFVNAVVASDSRLPFGGVKHSGYGRELGVAGAREFTNLRSIVVGTAGA